MSDARSSPGPGERWLIRIAYLGILLLATLSRLEPVLDPAAAFDRAGRMLEPGYSTALLVDAVRNVLLFAGWGLVWVATAHAGSRGRSEREAQRRALWGAFATGTAISLGVETLQLFSANRRASVLDIAANAGGALLGAMALLMAIRWLARRREARSFVGLPAAVFGACYTMVIFGEVLMPLFRRTRLRVWGSPINRLDYALDAWDPWALAPLPLTDIVLFVPAGFFLLAAFVEGGLPNRRAAVFAGALGSGLVVAAEVSHGMLSVPIHTGAMVIHALGIVAGCVLGARLLPRVSKTLNGAERSAWLLVAYCVVIGLWFLRPYVPEPDPAVWVAQLRSDWWQPLAFAAYRMDLFTVVDVTNTFFLFFPLGGLLAVWPLRASGRFSGILPGIVLAAVLESAQIMISGRTLAVADVVIAAAAIWAGHAVARRAALSVRGAMVRPSRITDR